MLSRYLLKLGLQGLPLPRTVAAIIQGAAAGWLVDLVIKSPLHGLLLTEACTLMGLPVCLPWL